VAPAPGWAAGCRGRAHGRGALLLRVDVALPVLAAAMVIALAAVELRLGSQERSDLRLMRMCQRIGRMVRVPSRAPWPPGGA
jgi:hypothetical protein